MALEQPTLHMLCGKIAAGKPTFPSGIGRPEDTAMIAEDDGLTAPFFRARGGEHPGKSTLLNPSGGGIGRSTMSPAPTAKGKTFKTTAPAQPGRQPHFGNRKVTTNRAPQPSGPFSGASAQ